MTLPDIDEEAFASPLEGTEVKPTDEKAVKLNLSGRVILAMTNLPSKIYKDKEDWKIEHVRGNAALYSSFYYLDQQTEWDTHLVGWTGEISPGNDSDLKLSDKEKTDLTGQINAANNSKNIHPVWLLEKDQKRWRQYAEQVLWKIFHYIQQSIPGTSDGGSAEDQWWQDYVRFNEAYATKILLFHKPGDIIWIHDYYLLLLPQLIRLQVPDANIGLYLHTTFPSSEYFRCLSKRDRLLEGMLGAHRIGFQSGGFAKHFISSSIRILGCEASGLDGVNAFGRFTRIEALSTGIDTAKTVHDAFEDAVTERVKTIREIYKGKKIIVGRDRLDSVRGVSQKLAAFERFLSMYPEWRERVVLIQVSSPLVLGVVEDYEREVAELVAYINGTYGTLHSTPVQHYQMRIDKVEYLALLRLADLGLITTIRDGMNTTALEFVACQKVHCSPLVLSEFSGSTTILDDAILVNPWDSVGVAKTIREALLFTEPKRKAIEERMYAGVAKNTIQFFTNKFLSHLLDDFDNQHEFHATPTLDLPAVLKAYNRGNKRLFMFDYDGTLTDIVRDPDAAIPSERVIHILSKLAADEKNEIWIISGRDQKFLDTWLGSKIPSLGLSAEHGCFIKLAHSKKWVNLTETLDMLWQKDVEDVFNYFSVRTPGSFLEKKKVALTWHYRKADPEFGEFQAKELKQYLSNTVAVNYDVEVMSGKANVEVRPKFVNKGEIAKKLMLRNPGEAPIRSVDPENVDLAQVADFVMCAGDDKTDEDMFESLITVEELFERKNKPKNVAGDYGIYPTTVGPASKKTIAKAHLLNPNQVLDTLALLIGEKSVFDSVGTLSIDDTAEEAESK